MKAFLNWSGGKDAAFSLYKAIRAGVPVEALLTSLTVPQRRISMHGVREELLREQAASVRLPLFLVEQAEQQEIAGYEAHIHASNQALKELGYDTAVFGDIFLEDLRRYREGLYEKDGISCHFPLWKKDSRQLLLEFISLGFKAVVVCVNGSKLDRSFCGREIDHAFARDLPPDVDACGENGEYHSFVFDGPVFDRPVKFDRGEIAVRSYPSPAGDPSPLAFYFQDLLPY